MNLFSTAKFAALVSAAAFTVSSAQAATITGLFNTGVDAFGVALAGGNGVTDTHYSIAASTEPGVVGNQAVTYHNPGYPADDANSRWVSLSANGMTVGNGSTTVYRLTFDLTGFDYTTAAISGIFAADNGATVYLNGANSGFTNATYGAFTAFNLTSGFTQGLNTLDFSVVDFGPPTAFRVDNLAGAARLAQTGGVPEPATWAMLIVGFGLTGAAARARRELVTRA